MGAPSGNLMRVVRVVLLRQRIDDTWEFLLLKRSDSGEWELPGGKAKCGENALAAAIREVGEESGVGFNSAHLLAEYPSRVLPHDGRRWAGWTVKEFVLSTILPDEPAVHLSSEHTDYQWADSRQVLRNHLPLTPLPERFIRDSNCLVPV